MMRKFLWLVIIMLVIHACSPKHHVLRVNFENSSVPASPDYSKINHWAALPEKHDAADSIPKKSGLKNLQSEASVDVFFIHPTTFTKAPVNNYQWNADVNDTVLNRKTQLSTIMNQASIFNGSCRVYAPYYRQAHYYSFLTPNRYDAKLALDLAYADVKEAFEYYLANFNEDRPIIIASHSQGSVHAERLLREFFDGKTLQKKLIMAYLVGRAIKPDAFINIRPTELPDETGVWASWNTFTRGYVPDSYDRYFKGSVSTNPMLWNSSEVFTGKEHNAGGVGYHFTLVPNAVDAQNHQQILWVSKPYVKGRMFLRTKVWHFADMNLFYMNIRDNIALRVAKYKMQQESSP